MAQNRGGEAIAHLEKAARRSSDANIETLLGAALGSAGRRAEAIEQLRQTTARRPPFTPAFQELAGQLANGKLTSEFLEGRRKWRTPRRGLDRKSTRLNSSHVSISYAVFC